MCYLIVIIFLLQAFLLYYHMILPWDRVDLNMPLSKYPISFR
jgi:hypothetical protein